MMNDPIVVWPPGTFNATCDYWENMYDCTDQFPGYQEEGYVACCYLPT